MIHWPEVPPQGYWFASQLTGAGVAIAPATLEDIRARAPKLVTSGATLDFKTLTPERGGLFDYRVFGPGTVIDAPIGDDDAAHQPRNVTFGRLVLARPLPHPSIGSRDPAERAAQLVSEHVMRELAVLPPDLRPLQRLDDDRWQSSSLNDLYRRVIQRNERLAKLVEANTEPAQIVAEELALHDALLALFDNERQPQPVLDALGQPLGSLRWLVGDLERGLRASAGTVRAHKVEAVAFAIGFTLTRA